MTLIVGAGVSMPRGIPSWPELVRRMWERMLGGTPPDLRSHPLASQFALEIIRHELTNTEVARSVLKDTGSPPSQEALLSDVAFTTLLRQTIYQYVDFSGVHEDTLSVIAELLVTNPQGRIVRTLSLNADDLLEREVDARLTGRRLPQPITRPRNRPTGAIPIYHLHGYLGHGSRFPRDTMTNKKNYRSKLREDAPEQLVFTDREYWAVSASPFSFANRVFGNALHDSHCVFIGLSMTDVNVIRWLGIHADETIGDLERELGHRVGLSYPAGEHYWIRPETDDPGRLVTRFLATRGVKAVAVEDWTPAELRRILAPLFDASP